MRKATHGAKMTADDFANDVRAWIVQNRNAPPHWIGIAKRLSTYPDMIPAWRELAKRNIRGRHIMGMAMKAAERANSESKRMPSAEESEQLRAVEDAAQKLIAAIDRAPLLDSAIPFEIDGKVMSFAWRPSGTASARYCLLEPVVELTDLLAFAAERAAVLRQGALEVRIIKRRRADPVAVSFVRHLAIMLRDATGEKMMGTVARIATVALDRHEPITKQQVESFLRNPSE